MHRKKFLEILRPSLASVRASWPALVAIQFSAVMTVLCYYLFPEFRQFCGCLALYKQRAGWFFAPLCCMVTAGIFPELLKLAFRPKDLPRPNFSQLLHQLGLFGLLGTSSDRFYQLQSVIFGHGKDLGTVFIKILFDQFAYTLFVVMPVIVLFYLWQEKGYSLRATLGACSLELLIERGAPLFVGNFCFWVPALLAVYSLPTELQFLLAQLIGAAWGTLVVYMARKQAS